MKRSYCFLLSILRLFKKIFRIPMTCPVCFFRDETQKHLKEQCFGIDRFEDKLEKYKELFIQGVRDMSSISKCNCYSNYSNRGMILWTDEFLKNLKDHIDLMEETFDELISCYIDYISKNQKTALDNLWNVLKINNLVTGNESPITYSKLIFRGRQKGNFNTNDKTSFFHIPFNSRHLIGNQRFSIDGQPMVYFGSSVLAVEKELGLNINDLCIAAFLPTYSIYCNKKIFSLQNYINDVIENNFPGIFGAGSKLSYDDSYISMNRNSIGRDIKKTLLMQICTFPVEHRSNYIAEYTIPQMLTTALMNDEYTGIIFPSTKDFSNLSDYHRFSSHHINFGFFVSFDRQNNIDSTLLDSFYVYTMDGTETYSYTVDSILYETENIINKNKKKPNSKNNDYILAIVKLKLHIEYLSNSHISGEKYFETTEGKIELEFYMKMLKHLDQLVANNSITNVSTGAQ